MLHAVDHLVIAVRDLGEARERYSKLLGRDPWWNGRHPGFGTENALYDLSGVGLELLSPAGEGPGAEVVSRGLESRGEGLVALAFATDDASGCSQALRARGLRAGDPRPGRGDDPATGAERHWLTVDLPLSATRGLFLFAIERLDREPARSEEAPPQAPPPGGGARSEPQASVVEQIDHIVIAATDLDASRKLYGDILGLRLALDRSFEDRGLRMLFFRLGGVTVEVVGRLGPDARPDDPDRFGGLAYRVGDADAARTRVAAAGFDVSGVRKGAKPGTRVCTVRDGTCGVPTLLLEPAA